MRVFEQVRVEEIIRALRELGGEAAATTIKDRVTTNRSGRPHGYRHSRSFRETIQHVIEEHCRESEIFSKAPLFTRVARGRYRLLGQTDELLAAA